ncbi:hypothetical protein TcCL_NonESM01597 [Trypanosoma cruzi]|nr:hypothetical protein TcCL_NonESM01597 [Trypanosoma cruzi]
MSLWGCCSCYTGTVSSELYCPFTRACVESPSVFPIVFSATSAGAFISDGDVACGMFSVSLHFQVSLLVNYHFFSFVFFRFFLYCLFWFFLLSSSSSTFSSAPTPSSGVLGKILTPLSSVGVAVEDALLLEGLFKL